jgi:hypothetical protein
MVVIPAAEQAGIVDRQMDLICAPQSEGVKNYNSARGRTCPHDHPDVDLGYRPPSGHLTVTKNER